MYPTDTGSVVPPLSGEQLLFLFGQLFVLLFTARVLGETVRYFDYPSVLGELLAGIVLGPSILGTLAPGLFISLFPPHPSQYHLLEAVSWLGLLMLLVITGFETDLDLIASRIGRATSIASTSIVVPFVLGFGVAWVLPSTFLAAEGDRFVFSLFIATALSISAIPVIAKILLDLGIIEREISQLIITSGMIDDTVGWILLAVVAGLARGQGETVITAAGTSIFFLAVFLLLAFTIGLRSVERLIRWVDSTFNSDLALVTTVMILALGVGTLTHALGLEAVLGAFVVGVLVGRVKRFDQEVRHVFEVVTLGIFAPIFFAMAGLRVDLTALADPSVLLVGSLVLGIATIGKFSGAFIGARRVGLSNWEGIAIGAGLNARGALEIIVATVGLSLGVLNGTMYTIIVVIAIVTSLSAPPMLRFALDHVELSEEETRRLRHREREERSFLGTLQRVLLPTRCSVHAQLAAQLLGHLGRNRDLEVTSMYVVRSEPKQTSFYERIRALFSTYGFDTPRTRSNGGDTPSADVGEDTVAESCLDLTTRQLSLPESATSTQIRRTRGPVSEAVVGELHRGYDLLALGMGTGGEARGGRDGSGRPLFELGIEDVLRATPTPIMAVNANIQNERRPLDPVPIRRILVPTVGTEYSRHAAEIAFEIALDCNALVEIVHVVDLRRLRELFVGEADVSDAVDIGAEIVDREATLGQQLGAEVLTDVLVSEQPERTIIERAAANEADLIVLGSELRSLSRRAFFGYPVEYVLKNAPCSVAVVSSR
ncbi:cation:proton antiporter domain-containing protein [Haladaptatus caseinilyticus]|uniref:cation:proton antiporter domain-containing protein n=1 Tax=Haladaptatus caseinilyticus TaxID=2993314 RepID=UPI00224B04FE|nr:cation:proton antiporter [Haladaptatus caseinilyticus]